MDTGRSVERHLEEALTARGGAVGKGDTIWDSSYDLERKLRKVEAKKKAAKAKAAQKVAHSKYKQSTMADDASAVSNLSYGEGGGGYFDTSYQNIDDDDGNMSSNRSWGSMGSFGTVSSQVSLLTSREMVQKIEESARKDQPRPSFVPTLRDLPQSKITWNGELLRIKKAKVPLYKQKQLEREKLEREQAREQKKGRRKKQGNSKLLPAMSASAPSKTTAEAAAAINAVASMTGGGGAPSMAPSGLVASSRVLKASGDWDKRQRVINIIGCHQPIELLLAKADERVRKQKKSMGRRQNSAKQHRDHLQQVLAKKYTRAERFGNQLKTFELQKGWLKMVVHAKFLARLKKIGQRTLAHSTVIHAAMVLQKMWRRYCMLDMWRKMFQMSKKVDLWKIKLRVRILRKRFAVKKIIQAMTAFKDKDNVALVIHKYIHAVKKVQRFMRCFVNCKKARVKLLQRRWHRLEVKYIDAKQAEKEILKKKGGKQMLKLESLPIPEATMIEMGKQQEKFDIADAVLNAAVLEQTKTGLLTKKDRRAELLKIQIPHKQIYTFLRQVVETRRKIFIQRQIERAMRMQRSLLDFKAEDALSLLTVPGASEKIAQRMKAAAVRFQPFVMHRDVTDAELLGYIDQEHLKKGTFIAAVKHVSELEVRRRILADKEKAMEARRIAADRAAEEEAIRTGIPVQKNKKGKGGAGKKRHIKRQHTGEVADHLIKGVISPERVIR